MLPAPPLGWQWSLGRSAGRRRRARRGQRVMPACSFTPDLFGPTGRVTLGLGRGLGRLRQAALHLRKQPLESFGKPLAAVPGGLVTRPHPQRRDLLIAPGHRRLRHRLGPHLGADAPSTAPRQRRPVKAIAVTRPQLRARHSHREIKRQFCKIVGGVITEPCGMPRRLSRASVVRRVRPRWSVSPPPVRRTCICGYRARSSRSRIATLS